MYLRSRCKNNRFRRKCIKSKCIFSNSRTKINTKKINTTNIGIPAKIIAQMNANYDAVIDSVVNDESIIPSSAYNNFKPNVTPNKPPKPSLADFSVAPNSTASYRSSCNFGINCFK